jgi:hypothetical protein
MLQSNFPGRIFYTVLPVPIVFLSVYIDLFLNFCYYSVGSLNNRYTVPM